MSTDGLIAGLVEIDKLECGSAPLDSVVNRFVLTIFCPEDVAEPKTPCGSMAGAGSLATFDTGNGSEVMDSVVLAGVALTIPVLSC